MPSQDHPQFVTLVRPRHGTILSTYCTHAPAPHVRMCLPTCGRERKTADPMAARGRLLLLAQSLRSPCSAALGVNRWALLCPWCASKNTKGRSQEVLTSSAVPLYSSQIKSLVQASCPSIVGSDTSHRWRCRGQRCGWVLGGGGGGRKDNGSVKLRGQPEQSHPL